MDIRTALGTEEEPTELYFSLLSDWRDENVNWRQASLDNDLPVGDGLRSAHYRMRVNRGENAKGLAEVERYEGMVVKKHQISQWGKGGEGFRSEKIVLEPDNSTPQLTRDDIENIFDKSVITPYVVESYSPGSAILEIPLPDLHSGMAGQHVTAVLSRVAGKVTSICAERAVDEIVVVLLGDFLHYGNTKRTTNSGTALESSAQTPYEMLESSFNSLVQFILNLSRHAPVKVKGVTGNHADILEYACIRMVQEKIEAEDVRASVEVTEKRWVAHRFFDTLVAFTHGDVSKQEMNRFMPRVFSAEWGACTDWFVHAGHKHRHMVDDSGVAPVHYFPAMCPKNEWEDLEQGYTHHKSECHIHVWTEDGLDEIRKVRV